MQKTRNFHELDTSRLHLRELTMKDAEFIYNLYSDSTVCKYLYDEELFTQIEESECFIKWNTYSDENSHNRWGIRRKEDNEIIGTIGFHQWDQQNFLAEIGYDLAHQFWGKGYMSEALSSIIKYGFLNLNLNRIHAFVALENSASIKLLEKFSFKREGIFRDRYFCKEEFHDVYNYSLLKKEWDGKNKLPSI